MLAAVAGAVAAAFLAGAGAVFGGGGADKLLLLLASACGFQGTMFLGAVWQGWRAGGGDWRGGLGIARVQRPRVIALLCAAALAWMVCFVGLARMFPALEAFVKSSTPDLLAHAGMSGPVTALIRLLLLAVLAPVSEEFFFRGWLWESLRRRGRSPIATAAITAVPWLALHALDSPWRVLFLIPAAVIFSSARLLGRSVLASLTVHVTNNTVVVAMQTIGEALGET